MSDLKTLIEEGQQFLAEAKPEVKSVEVTHFAPDEENPGDHKSTVRYTHGKNTHHYELHTVEHPKKAGKHTVHIVNPVGEPLKGADGKYEPPIHNQVVLRKEFETHGGRKVHQLLVRNFTDRLHPAETKHQQASLVPLEKRKP